MNPNRLASILVVAFFCPHLAFAGFTLCNRTSQDKLIVATVRTWYAQDQATGEQVVDAESWGWTTIARGACVVVHPYPIRFDTFYIYAYSAANPSIRWTGKYNYCGDLKNNFDYPGRKRAEEPCPAGVPLGMMYVDTQGVDDYQFPILDHY